MQHLKWNVIMWPALHYPDCIVTGETLVSEGALAGPAGVAAERVLAAAVQPPVGLVVHEVVPRLVTAAVGLKHSKIILSRAENEPSRGLTFHHLPF